MVSPAYNTFVMLANCKDDVDKVLLKVAEVIYMEPRKVLEQDNWQDAVLNDLTARLANARAIDDLKEILK